jgi:hypothetical protein
MMESANLLSFCYTDPKGSRLCEAYLRGDGAALRRDHPRRFLLQRHQADSDIAAKGNASWTAFRLRLMDEVARNLVVGAARAVNPKVKIIIKFPNWYEHFQANGYDLEQEPKIFDGIYTGTETRDPVITRPAPAAVRELPDSPLLRQRQAGRQRRRLGRHLHDPLPGPLRRAVVGYDAGQDAGDHALPIQQSAEPAEAGDRNAWSGLHTSFNSAELEKWHAASGSKAPATTPPRPAIPSPK